MKSPEFIDSNKNNTDNNNLQSKPSRKRPRPLLSCGGKFIYFVGLNNVIINIRV